MCLPPNRVYRNFAEKRQCVRFSNTVILITKGREKRRNRIKQDGPILCPNIVASS